MKFAEPSVTLSLWDDSEHLCRFSGRRKHRRRCSLTLTRIGPAVGSAHPSGAAWGGLGGEIESRHPAVSPYGLSRPELEKLSELDLSLTDHATKTRLVRLTRVLPFAAFAAVSELADEYGPGSRAGFVVAVLTRWHRESRYV